MAGYDPTLMEQARAAMGYAPLVGVQPLTPEEQAFGEQAAQATALQQDVQNAQALAGGQQHAALAPVPQSMQPSIPLDWQPQAAQTAPVAAPQSQPDEPRDADFRARMGAFAKQVDEYERSGAKWRPEYSGRSDLGLGAMRAEAAQRRAVAEGARGSAGLDADIAQAGMEQAAEDLGGVRQRVAGQTAANRQQAAQAEAETRQRLDAEYDSHLKASEKVAARKREVDDYIGNYQVKDRRNVASKAMGALAVFAAHMQDQQNLIAGTNMGQPIVTNRGAQMAELIGRQIDRDLEQQREMLANKRTQSAALGTELGQARERWGDTREALLTAKQLKLNQYEQELEGIKAQGASEESVILADQAIAELRMQRAQIDEERARGDYDKAFADEQKFKLAQYAQQQAAAAARRPPTAKEALELEGKALDNAKKRQELGQNGKPLTAEQLKRQSLFEGKDEAANVIARAVASGEAAPNMFGRMAEGTVLRSAEGDEMDTAIAAMKDVLLRDESGASISEGDKASKMDAWGLERGGEARKRGLRMMLAEYNARKKSVGLEPTNAVVRRGAAR